MISKDSTDSKPVSAAGAEPFRDEQDLQDLIFRVIEGLAGDAEREELRRLLAANPQARRQHAQLMWLHTMVLSPAGRRQRGLADHVS